MSQSPRNSTFTEQHVCSSLRGLASLYDMQDKSRITCIAPIEGLQQPAGRHQACAQRENPRKKRTAHVQSTFNRDTPGTDNTAVLLAQSQGSQQIPYKPNMFGTISVALELVLHLCYHDCVFATSRNSSSKALVIHLFLKKWLGSGTRDVSVQPHYQENTNLKIGLALLHVVLIRYHACQYTEQLTC